MPADPFTLKCTACGSPWLDAQYDCTRLASLWRHLPMQGAAVRPTTLWRYAELLPLPETLRPVSMGEGWTPLTRAEGLEQESRHGGPAMAGGIWIKDERQQPTGSFKDRQAAVAVSALKAQGIGQVVLASTGNAAAAYAAYCARAQIKLWVFLPSSVPAEKMRELALYGAEVVKITGTYDQAKQVAADFAARRGLYLDRGAKAIPCKESMKTIAFEIAEQLGTQLWPANRPWAAPSTSQSDLSGPARVWQAPDWYIQAVSGGIGPLGVIKGFVELYEAGLTDRVPKLGLVQAEGCAPMVRAWERGLDHAEPVQPDSLITVLATGDPGPAYSLLKRNMDRFGGALVAVNDGDAFRTMRRIARLEGFSMEPAASVAFAGLDQLLAKGLIQPGERVVINCSGHTFSAEKHALEDRYVFSLEMDTAAHKARRPVEGLATALKELDEQITTIVVIDDNPHDSRLIRRLLQSYKHYRVFEAYNGRDGIDLVRQRQPDLVVLDLTLPDMDGLSILATLKADARTGNIPIVVISAKSLTSDEQTYLTRYTDSVWQKGNLSARDLLGHVVELLGDDAQALDVSAPDTSGRAQESFGNEPRWRILVVEDNMCEARLMRRLLESRQRFQVLEAYSGAEALATAASRPDLIILDLMLPDISGERLLEQWRTHSKTRDIPVVVLTAKELDSSERARLVTAADSVWPKGALDRSSLLAHVEAILQA
jgi:threonine synthase